ncbi:solute carrier family 2, facilitated glucose transporter member 11-like isoform X2 [Polyodon spathula]|uniref:solute carrier family 2, facilitated glucose transporter member 11-like isoform X2 n=1 Tax=Polyodon spathula TaxID=7913 RepID=UPI001B7DD19F|nr:solute carrier family 2, facilitated glucose transporter member 11-like isoform X2 [Polyodon spathula]
MISWLSVLLQSWMLMVMVIILGLGGSFQYGFQISVINAPSDHIQRFINETWLKRYGTPMAESTVKLIWSIIVSIFSIGAVVGSISSGQLSVKYGRKNCLLLNNVVALGAATLAGLSKMAGSFEMIILGRFLYGCNVGIGLNVHLMYLVESSPRELRGFMSLSSCVFIGLGKCLGQIFGLKELLGGEEMWPYLLAFSGAPALLQLVGLFFFPDSPRYLFIEKGNEEGCVRALTQLWGKKDFKMELEDMAREWDKMKGQKAKTVLGVLRNRSVRWQMLTLIFPCAGVQLCGISASFLIECIGRKKLMGFGYALMAIVQGILVLMLFLKDHRHWIPYFNVFLLYMFICIYGSGPSGASMALPADMFTQAWRAPAYVVIGLGNSLGLFLVGMCFPFVVALMGQFSFLIFTMYCVLAAAFTLRFVPETKGKTVLEITEDFNKLNFKGKGSEVEGMQKKDVAITTKL